MCGLMSARDYEASGAEAGGSYQSRRERGEEQAENRNHGMPAVPHGRRKRNTGEFLRPNGLHRRGRYRIEFAVSLLDPTRADMALYSHADMVRSIARTCRV